MRTSIAFACAAGLSALSACGTVYISPEGARPHWRGEAAYETTEPAPLTYRRLLERLDTCMGAYHRVRGEPYVGADLARIRVDAGVGFETTLFLGTALYMEVEIRPGGQGRTLVRVLETGEGTAPFARAIPGWLEGDTARCRA